MIHGMRLMALLAALLMVLVMACGGGEDESGDYLQESFGLQARGESGSPGAPAPAAMAYDERVVTQEVIKEVLVEVVVEKEVIKEVEVPGETVVVERPVELLRSQAAGAPLSDPDLYTKEQAAGELDSGDSTDDQAALVSQRRIIVRTADLSLVVDDVSGAIDEVSRMAESMGGWVVSSDRSTKHSGFVSVRVPAESLEETIDELRELAVEVQSEVTTSKDVTDEYVDTTARLTNMQATQAALIRLLERAEKVEDALKVQNELTRVQEEIERLQGRIKFLEQTSAFSLVNVRLSLASVEMGVDAGADRTVSVGRAARFRATFEPPEGMEEFNYTWDFGDGNRITETRTAPTVDEGKRVTATVTHVYGDDRDSPFIVGIEITGFGDEGLADGSDTVIVTVTKIPSIEVFAGESMTVEAGQSVDLDGSFTRPEGLTDQVYRWDFGDGSAPVTEAVAEGATRAVAAHAYADPRPFPYTVTLTVTGQSDAGEIEGTSSLNVYVIETEAWVLSGWSPLDTWKLATRALSGVGVVVSTALIFAAIFSPVWLIVGGALLFWRRKRRARVDGDGPETEDGPTDDAPEAVGQED